MNRWLTLSLAVNLILMGLLFSSRHSEHPAAPPIRVPTLMPAPAVTKQEPTPRDFPASASGSDWRSWLEQIRAAGVPDKVVAGLVAADFEVRWDEQQRELQRKYENGDVDAGALAQADAEHDSALDAELRLALGDTGFRRWDEEKTLRDFNLTSLNLTASERDALYQLRKNLLVKQKELEDASAKGEVDETDVNQKLTEAQTDYDQQTKALLGADRYAAMNASPDPAAAELKRQMKGMNLSDDQMTALLQAQQQWSRQAAEINDDASEYQSQMQTVEAARNEAFKKILGPDGYADYEKQQDTAYQTLKHYANAWQLTPNDVDYLYSAIQNYNQNIQSYLDRAKAVEAQGQSVDWNGVQKNIDSFSQQTEQTLNLYLGNDQLSKMEQNGVFNFSFQN